MQSYNRIALLTNPGKLEIKTEPIPIPKIGQLLIKIVYAGICGSDLHYFRHGGLGSFKTPLPMYMGHEPAGIVVDANNVKGFNNGDRVAIEPGCPCLTSKWSLMGKHNLCTEGTFMGANKTPGCFATFVCVNSIQVFKVPDSIDLSLATLCEPLAVALHTFKLCNIKNENIFGGSAVIFGSGSIGLCQLIILKSHGIKNIYVVDNLEYRRKIATSLGAKKTFTWDESIDCIKKLTNYNGCELVIDCAGTTESFNSSIKVSAINGVLALVGIPEVDHLEFNAHQARTKELLIINVRRSNQCLEECLKLIEESPSITKDCEQIITHKMPLENIQSAFEMASSYDDCVKILIEPETHKIPIKRIGFLGLSDYGLEYFKHLISDDNYEIVYATSKSKKRDHSNELEIELENLCKDNSIPYFGNINVNKHIHKFLNLNVDIVILGGYDGILKEEFLNKSSKYGVINTHFGIIPMNRGCNPSMWAILKNLPQGFTTYFCNTDIDLSDKIIDIQEVKVPERCTSEKAYKLLSNEAVKRLPIILKSLQSGIYDMSNMKTIKKMNEKGNNYHCQGMPNDSYVSWDWKCKFIERFSDSNLFRPYPTIRTVTPNDKEIWFEVKYVTHVDDMNEEEITIFHTSQVGQVLSNSKYCSYTQPVICARDGFVHCEIQSSNITDLKEDNLVILKSVGNVGKHGIYSKFSGTYLDIDHKQPNIPIFDLKFEPGMVKEFCDKASDIMTSNRPISDNKYVREFECEFGKLVKSPYTIAVNSGTMALEIALRAINVKNKIVITPSNTFFATQCAVKNAGGNVEFVDIEPDYLQVCPNKLNDLLSRYKPSEVKAVVLVHIGGIISPHFKEIRSICDKYEVKLIEDAAHAHLSNVENEYAGTIGHIGAFSFFPTKVMTAGEAGMITTTSENLYKLMLSIRQFGRQIEGASSSQLVQIEEDGVNGKINEFTGLLGSLECRRVGDRIKKRTELLKLYIDNLDKQMFKVIKQENGVCANYKCIVILIGSTKNNREKLKEYAKKNGISFTGEVYFKGVHQMTPYKEKEYNLPITEEFCENHVCPPLYPELTTTNVLYVCKVMNNFKNS